MQTNYDSEKTKGNEQLKTCIETAKSDQKKLAPIILKSRLIQAQSHYFTALDMSKNAQPPHKNFQMSSIHKNMLVAHQLWIQLDLCEDKDEIKIYHFDQMIDHLNQAIYFGFSCQSKQWIQHLITQGKDQFALLEKILSDQDSEFRSDYIESKFWKMNKECADLLIRMTFKLSDAFYKVSIKQLQKDTALAIKEAFRMINKAKQYYCITYEISENYKNVYPSVLQFWETCQQETGDQFKLGQDINRQFITCQVEMEMAEGKRCFNRGLMDAEVMDMEGIYDSLDSYNTAGKLAFDNKDTELEARSEAAIGKIWYKAIKNQTKARMHFINSTRLANTLFPRDVYSMAWYKLAIQDLQEIRDKQAQDEQAQANAEREKHIAKIKDIFDPCVEAQKKGVREFVEHLNSKHVKEAERFTFTDEDFKEGKMRKTLLKICAKMHPDKFNNESEHVKYFQTEITKMLNNFYERYK